MYICSTVLGSAGSTSETHLFNVHQLLCMRSSASTSSSLADICHAYWVGSSIVMVNLLLTRFPLRSFMTHCISCNYTYWLIVRSWKLWCITSSKWKKTVIDTGFDTDLTCLLWCWWWTGFPLFCFMVTIDVFICFENESLVSIHTIRSRRQAVLFLLLCYQLCIELGWDMQCQNLQLIWSGLNHKKFLSLIISHIFSQFSVILH
jgi:hypothetical protein